MGTRAAEYVIQCLESVTNIQHTHLEATLILRGTTAPPLPANEVFAARRLDFKPRLDTLDDAYVVTRDSPAKKQGKEVIFQVCGDRCALELNTAMSKEMNLLS